MDRSPYLTPPVYDIDAILEHGCSNSHQAFDAILSLYEAIEQIPESTDREYYRPDSSLLVPEVVLRDIIRQDLHLSNGFAAGFGYSGGIPFFFRALRAMRVVGHPEALRILEAVREIVLSLGVSEPTAYPDDSLQGDYGVDWDVELEDKPDFDDEFEKSTRAFDDQWFAISHNYQDDSGAAPSLHQSLCEYLNKHRAELRVRKP